MENIIKLILSNVPLVLFILSFIVSFFLFKHKREGRRFVDIFLNYFILLNVGISFLYNFVVHVFFGEMTAAFIGWSDSPFQAEVGYASLGFGIVGLISFLGDYPQKVLAVIGPSLFLLGAAFGHIYEYAVYQNVAPGNVGTVLWMDILIPIFGVGLLIMSKKSSNKS